MILATAFALFVSALQQASLLEPAPPAGTPSGINSPSRQAGNSLPTCAGTIRDQANPGSCLQASSVPAPGLLFPPPHDGGVNNTSSGTNSFIGGGSQNATLGSHPVIGGGQLNDAGDFSVVGGGFSNNATLTSSIGGGLGNTANGLSAVAGGSGNSASGGWAVIGGGYTNATHGYFAVIGGGYQNIAFGYNSVIGGGRYNATSGYHTVVAGGILNVAAGSNSVVSGGSSNTASGNNAMIPGGDSNLAQGNFSFAAGRRAKATHRGSFVWGDNQNVDKTSSAENEFNVYASGGVRIFSDAAATTGVILAPGSGTWSSVSDVAQKANLEPVDSCRILEEVVSLPIWTWNYGAQDASIRHMGPTAQDFRSAFGLGTSDTLIDSVDPDGVALAAIQGLHTMLREKDARIAALEAAVEELRRAPQLPVISSVR